MQVQLSGPTLTLHPAHLAAGLTGLLLGVGLGILVADERVWPIVALPLLALGLWAAVRSLVPPEDRALVGAVIALSFALHVAVAVVLYTGALAAGRGGFIPGDDAEYAFLARTFVAYLKGQPDPASVPPYWGGAAYLFGTWVYLESAIFYLIGPEVLVPILLNGAFALGTALLVYDMGRRLFDRRAALVALALTAFFPSLVLWSSLNLKDALALLLIGLCLRSLVLFQQRPGWRTLALAFAVLVAMESLRDYIFVGLAVLIPMTVAVTPHLAPISRLRWTGAAMLASAFFLSAFQTGVGLGPQLLGTFESGRHAMAVGARTAYVEPPPVIVKEGDTFLVPSRPTGAAATPRVIHVAPNTRLVLVTGEPTASPSPGVALVRPGDLVVVGGPDRTPAPVLERQTIRLAGGSVALVSGSRVASADAVVLGTLRHLPVGMAFAFLGPFPWHFARQLDYLIVPDNLLWYVCLGALVTTVMRERRRWRALAPLVLFVVGLLGLFSLVEGNWGTLFRHRAMAIPWALMLAAPSLSLLYRSVASKALGRQ